ncbi:MAG: DUF4097 family beta strand repeat-containing protein [Clostridiales bacterium]|nr:DUF4097 family beta strand repeat-containing protein [Clostridiales bacterium]
MKKKLTALSCVSLLVLMLSGCSKGNNMTNKMYTEETMNHFYSDKIAIDDISKIEIESNYADFEIIASDAYYVEYSYYYINNEPKLTVNDHTLTFSDYGMNTGNYSINQKEKNYFKVYVPTTNEFESVSINKSSGDCNIGTIITDQLSLTNHYGDTIVANCQVNKMETDIASGNIGIKNCKIQNLSIKNAYGGVELDSINDSLRWMDSLEVKMSSGNLELSNLFCKEMELDNSYGTNEIENCAIGKLEGEFDSGDVTLSHTLTDDISMDNSYGNINLNLIGREADYRFDIKSDYGSVKIGDSTYEGSALIDRGGKKSIELKVSSGDVEISFEEQ